MPRLSPQQVTTLCLLSETWGLAAKQLMGTTLRALKRMGLVDRRVVGRKSNAVVQWKRTELGTIEMKRIWEKKP